MNVNFTGSPVTVSCDKVSPLYTATTNATCSARGAPFDVSACDIVVNTQNTSCAASGGQCYRKRMFVYPRDLDPARWPLALCNNSTSFGFYISYPSDWNSLTPAQRRQRPYQIELQGGGQCIPKQDAPSGPKPCEEREQGLLGMFLNNGAPLEPAPRGQPHDEREDNSGAIVDRGLENAIKVHGVYCSSDVWSGTNPDAIADNMPGGISPNPKYPAAGMTVVNNVATQTYAHWPMTGHFNVQAMLDVLSERFGLVDSNPTLRIHLRGQSAGGWGTVQNVYALVQRFPLAAGRNAQGLGGIQASPWQNWTPLNFPSTATGTPVDLSDAGITPSLIGVQAGTNDLAWRTWSTPACNPTQADGPQRARCAFATTLYDFITAPANATPVFAGGPNLGVPMLVYHNRQDQLYMNLAGLQPLDNQGNAFTPADGLARMYWIQESNVEMGLAPATAPDVSGPVRQSSRIRWLFSPNDPVQNTRPSTPPLFECNVHPPLDWLAFSYTRTDATAGFRDGDPHPQTFETNITGPTAQTLEMMTYRFWSQCGRAACGSTSLGGEVLTYSGTSAPFYSVNYVSSQWQGCN